jgi:hypothetical protein
MKRFKHNLSHYKLLTCDMGKLVPVGCVEVLPGDTFQHQTDVMVRVSPLAAPVMHPVHVRIHHFFVPNRLTWSSWEDFITGGPDGTNADTVPTLTTNSREIEKYLYDIEVNGVDVNILPLRAYNEIWNNYYRDVGIESEVGTSTAGNLLPINWEKDYLSTARPWADLGDDVTLPVGSLAPIQGLSVGNAATDNAAGASLKDTARGTYTTTGGDFNSGTHGIYLDTDGNNNPTVYADLASATAIPLNDFRRALALQRYQEARSRYGSRYVEYLRYLGVTSSDGRLDRPEYLGGGKTTINFSEVLQTGPETGTSPTNAYGVGDMYGHGVAALRANGYRRFFEEHGFVISLMSVRPKAIYADGVDRQFLRQDKEDYFQKELQFIGQQEVYDNEVYADSANTRSDVFGYQDRYAEYRSKQSRVLADFTSTLDHYHQARLFSSQPTLNASFINCDATKRIHNVTSTDALWVMVNHRLVSRRLVSKSAYARTI